MLATFAPEQARPQAPQFAVSVSVSVSQPSSAVGAAGIAQLARPVTQLELHEPLLHEVALVPLVEQARPQAPQFATSEAKKLSQPLSEPGKAGSEQFPKPPVQLEVHRPAVQVRLLVLAYEHARPHPPQLSGLVFRFASHPSSASAPGGSWQLP